MTEISCNDVRVAGSFYTNMFNYSTSTLVLVHLTQSHLKFPNKQILKTGDWKVDRWSICILLTQSEGGEVSHKIDSGLSPPGHQSEGQVVSC